MFLAGCIGPFKKSSDVVENQVDIDEQICNARINLSKEESPFALVIGRHDRRPLTEEIIKKFGSNNAIAQQRAEAVVSKLKNRYLECGELVIPNVLSIIAGPRNVNLTNLNGKEQKEALSRDRVVEVYGFKIL